VRKRGKLFRQLGNLFWNTFPFAFSPKNPEKDPQAKPEPEPEPAQLPETNDAIEFYEPH